MFMGGKAVFRRVSSKSKRAPVAESRCSFFFMDGLLFIALFMTARPPPEPAVWGAINDVIDMVGEVLLWIDGFGETPAP